jgi:hypothetical protein
MSGTSAAGFGRVVGLGPFFAFQTHRPESTVRHPWCSMRELVDDPEALADRVSGVRAQLAANAGRPPEGVELRVAASVTHLGLVARLVSPALAAAALYGSVLPVALGGVRWQPVPGGMFPLSLPEPPAAEQGGRSAALEALADGLSEALLDGPARELAEALRPLSVSERILRGNVASALNGAVTVLAGSPGVDRAEAGRARLLAALLLRQPALRGSAAADGRGRFRRRSCCLIYRAAPGGVSALCGDCVLRSRPSAAP